MAQNKVYGLILPKKGGPAKGKKAATSAFNVFGDDSDQEETQAVPVGPYGQGKATSKMKRQTQMDIDKALQEDPSVYEYDNIYDDMQAQKPTVGSKEKEVTAKDRKPKYIVGLLKAAEVKKKEDERRKERQVQKEREEEGSKYADKESFVTSAYKKKMLEMQAEEERERREAEMEALTDVTKQKDMSGFYRYLYRQTAGAEDVKQEPTSDGHAGDERPSERVKQESLDDSVSNVKEEPKSPVPHARARRHSTSSSSGSESSDSDDDDNKAPDLPWAKAKSRGVKSDSPPRPSRRATSPESRPQHRREDGRKNKIVDAKRRHDSSDSESDHDQSKKRRHDSSSSESHSDHSRSKSNETINKKQESLRLSEKEKGKDIQKRKPPGIEGKESNKRHSDDKAESEGHDSNTIGDNLREMRNESNAREKKDGKENKTPSLVDPAKKVYPHHNSAKDIEEARKRYLQRKLAREKAKYA